MADHWGGIAESIFTLYDLRNLVEPRPQLLNDLGDLKSTAKLFANLHSHIAPGFTTLYCSYVVDDCI